MTRRTIKNYEAEKATLLERLSKATSLKIELSKKLSEKTAYVEKKEKDLEHKADLLKRSSQRLAEIKLHAQHDEATLRDLK